MSWLDRPISQTWYVLALILALVIGFGLLAGCAAEAAAPPVDGPPSEMSQKQMHDEIRIAHVDVDGRKVTCVVFDSVGAGGLSCDWTRP